MSKASIFSATCSRLSQYIKQNGGVILIPDLTIQPSTTTITLDLFPTTAGLNSPAAPATEPGKIDKEKLTVFYGGEMMVFDDIPADKAMELMDMASSSCGASTVPAGPATAFTSAVVVERQPAGRPQSLRHPQSLRRFLEKRKERVISKAPYQADHASRKTAPTTEEVVSQSWLKLS